MSDIKITYFDLRGRAEVSRLALSIGEIPFTDERISFPEWKEIKPTTPYGSLPTMVVDGQLIAQSGAIDRYCSTVAGLYPSDPLQKMQIDEITGTLGDLMQAVFKYRGDDDEKMKEAREKYAEIEVPRYAGGLEKRLGDFASEGYAVGSSISLADLSIFAVVTTFKTGVFDYVPADVLGKYEKIMGIYTLVSEHPKVVEWYQKHPVKK